MSKLEFARHFDLSEWQFRSVQLRDLHPGNLGIHDPALNLSVLTRGTVSGAAHAVVIPVHNQESNIYRVLSLLSESTSLVHEVCIVIDDCSDDSLAEVARWVAGASDNLIERFTLVVSDQPLFETLCDVIGFALTAAPFIIEVQADMFVDDPGFDKRLLEWFDLDSLLLAVSGRGGHDLAQRPATIRAAKRLIRFLRDQIPGAYTPLVLEYYLSDEIGRTGRRISRTSTLKRADRLFLHETVLRGPLALRRELYNRAGGLDPSHFFLGDDDHDLCLRARSQGFNVGYSPIRFDSPLEAGSTRAERTDEQKTSYLRFVEYYSSRQASTVERRRHAPRVARKVLRAAQTSPAR